MEIDRKIIEKIKNNTKYKNELLNNNEKLEKEFFTSLKKYEKTLINNSSYETALWIESNEKNISSIGKNNNIKYKEGEIVLIDLGRNNYDNEFSYTHPAIIMKNTFNKIFIVPCTSQHPRKDSNGNIFPENMIGTEKDGFEKKSVLLLYDTKFVDKNRVISKIGKVTKDFYNRLNNQLFIELFKNKHNEIKKLENTIKQYENNKEKAKKTVDKEHVIC